VPQSARRLGHEVARAWGFEPVTLLTWCKPGLGVGRFAATLSTSWWPDVGAATATIRAGWTPRSGHRGDVVRVAEGRALSKPDEFYELVERLSPAPRLEMFARTYRVGWDCWGNEVESDIEIAADNTQRNTDSQTQERRCLSRPR